MFDNSLSPFSQSTRRNRFEDECDCHGEHRHHHKHRDERHIRDIRDIRERRRQRNVREREIREVLEMRMCRGCICDQLRRLETDTEVDVFLSGGQVLEDVVFVNFNRRNCCAFFEDPTTEPGSLLIVDCQKIDAIRIEAEDDDC